MKIKFKNKDIEIEFSYETRWWGSEYEWTELIRILPFISSLLNKEYFEAKLPSNTNIREKSFRGGGGG